MAGLLHGFLQAARAEIIRAAFQHGKLKFHRLRQRAEHAREHREIFFRELLLQIDGVRGDDGFFLFLHGEEDGGNQVGEAFADARAGLHCEMLAMFERARHGHGHLLLLRAEFEIFGARQNAGGREYFLDLFYEVMVASVRLRFDNADHVRAEK